MRNNVLMQIINHLPVSPVKNADGTYFENWQNTGYFNPLALVEQAKDNSKYNNLIGSFNTHVELPFNLSYDINLSYQNTTSLNSQAYASYLQSEYPNDSSIKQTVNDFAALALYPDKQLNTSVALNPANSPPDSQIIFSTSGSGVKHQQRFTLLPASHWLMDNNNAYTQETELQLMGVSAFIDQNQRLGIDRFTLYKMQSYTPHNPIVGGVSSKFLVQWGGNPFQAPNAPKGWVLSSAVGRTYQVTEDVDLFSFLGLGFGSNKQQDNIPFTAEVGAIVREVGNMKTVVSYERRHDFFNRPLVKEQLQIDQSKYVTRNFTLFGRLRQSLSGPIQFREWELGFKHLF
jgi:hypothetical protein